MFISGMITRNCRVAGPVTDDACEMIQQFVLYFSICREAISRLCEAVSGTNGAIKKRKVNTVLAEQFISSVSFDKLDK